MTYSSLSCVLTDEALVDDTLKHAISMARACDAHLDVLCFGIDATPVGYDLAGAGASLHSHTLEHTRTTVQQIEAQAKAQLERSDVLWSINAGIAGLPGLGWHVAVRARYSDLVILPKPYEDHRGADLEVITEAALFEADLPVLIVPDSAPRVTQPSRVMIGWNSSTESLNAVRAALPLLRQSDVVHIAIIDPPSHSPTRSDPGGLLAQYLARHRVKVEVNVLAKTVPKVADVLIRHATDIGADLIVMGAYGHSRIREAIFGGATRDMLQDAELPVLMAH